MSARIERGSLKVKSILNVNEEKSFVFKPSKSSLTDKFSAPSTSDAQKTSASNARSRRNTVRKGIFFTVKDMNGQLQRLLRSGDRVLKLCLR